jgi:hypothetical protein
MSQETHARGVPLLLRTASAALMLATSVSVLAGAASQRGVQQPSTPAGQATPRATSPLDLTGYWVSVVTEDWRWRMMTPPKGDAPGVPLSLEGRRVANAWDLAKDNASGNQCKAFGAGGIMRIPGRLHITWENDSTLRIDTDAGRQTRLVHMLSARSMGGGILNEAVASKPSQATLQGHSVGMWQTRNDGAPVLNEEVQGGRARGPATPSQGSLKVVTVGMRAGYFRKNGLPYSENAVLTEYFDRHDDFGSQWFTVLSVLEDPKYLISPFVTTTHFKREPDGSKWSPQPCETLPPTIDRVSSGENVG